MSELKRGWMTRAVRCISGMGGEGYEIHQDERRTDGRERESRDTRCYIAFCFAAFFFRSVECALLWRCGVGAARVICSAAHASVMILAEPQLEREVLGDST
jgi:hypothetical protein